MAKKVTKKKAAKKKTARRKTAKKKVTAKSVVRQASTDAKLEDYFDPETGELLNPKHEMFCQTWVQTFSNEKACEAAGLKVEDRSAYHNARRLLRQQHIQHRVREIVVTRAADMQINEEWVILKLIDVFELSMTDEPVTGPDGAILGYRLHDAKAAIRALELIGGNLGMFKKDTDKPKPGVVFNFNYGQPQTDDAERMVKRTIEGESRRLN